MSPLKVTLDGVCTIHEAGPPSLTAALVGQQAVVNTLGTIALAIHLRLINAAVAANVQRYIPSEFGFNTMNLRAAQLPVYADKIAVQQHLKRAAQESGSNFSYTLLFNTS